jgi:hypothetical protein
MRIPDPEWKKFGSRIRNTDDINYRILLFNILYIGSVSVPAYGGEEL